MILTILALIVPFIFLFLFDLDMFLVSSIYFYSVVILFKIYKKKKFSIDIILFFDYSLVLIIDKFFNAKNFLPFIGSVIYLSLVVYFTQSLIFGFLKKSKDKPDEERGCFVVQNIILITSNLISFILSISLYPSLKYIYIPLCISILSIPISLLFKNIFCKKELKK